MARFEKGNSSTWKELTAVKQVLLSLIHILSGKRIKWFTYNQNVVSIVSKGSAKTVLQELALDIFSACMKFNVNIDMVWIPRSENDKADYLVEFVIMTTGVYLMLYLNLLNPFGGHTRLINSPLITIISWLYFISDFGMCIPLALMPLLLIGMALMACLYRLYF